MMTLRIGWVYECCSHTGLLSLIMLAHCKYKSFMQWSSRLSSVPHQISKIKQDRCKILSSLKEIGVAEQEYDVRFCTGISYVNTLKVAPNPKIVQNSVQVYCPALLAMQLVDKGLLSSHCIRRFSFSRVCCWFRSVHWWLCIQARKTRLLLQMS